MLVVNRATDDDILVDGELDHTRRVLHFHLDRDAEGADGFQPSTGVNSLVLRLMMARSAVEAASRVPAINEKSEEVEMAVVVATTGDGGERRVPLLRSLRGQ